MEKFVALKKFCYLFENMIGSLSPPIKDGPGLLCVRQGHTGEKETT